MPARSLLHIWSEIDHEEDQDLPRSLEVIKVTLSHDWGTNAIYTRLGTHGVGYGEDDAGEYAVVGMTLPGGVYAELEGDTYGELQGFRIYKDDLPGF